MNSVIIQHLRTQIVSHCLLNIIHSILHGWLDYCSFGIHDTDHTSAFTLNVNLATFSYVSQMTSMTLIVLKEICNFKGFKFYNSNKVQLGNAFLHWYKQAEFTECRSTGNIVVLPKPGTIHSRKPIEIFSSLIRETLPWKSETK